MPFYAFSPNIQIFTTISIPVSHPNGRKDLVAQWITLRDVTRPKLSGTRTRTRTRTRNFRVPGPEKSAEELWSERPNSAIFI
ncbi:hypothetical protein L596_016702 [Steinernema carpocapsae]|uniref:Uncharacterized protein n=1 Tax=Steinernema carpocapsae TaxID=34508 RepID=A0A4U5NIR9_STECR|nr:hypothetical protein L596_016702 [Steinernema carpocapsae]